MNTSDVILKVCNLRKEFGGLVAVDDVSGRVLAHTLHAIIGPNGAGKTTLFNLMSGTMPPTQGQVFFKNHDITHLPPHRIAHLGIGRSFQITNIFPNLTVLENVRLAAQAMGKDSFKFWHHFRHFQQYEEKAQQIIERVGLQGLAETPASVLSHGDKRKLELGIMLASDPEVLLLDEPTAGMSSEQVPALLEIIHDIMRAGDKTIVLVEHRMDVVMSISDFITVMHQGRVLAEGTPQEIAANEAVQKAYLGALYGDLGLVAEA
ncbi:MAG TPA: ABC transporter ATP-binding protein [Chloroflexi bacterium]|nr:ABC transporter ATP-binding protein [Chloroflexota bacterium]